VEICLRHFFISHWMEVSDQLHALDDLPPGKNLRCPLNRMLGGPQSLPEHCEEDKSILSFPPIEPQPVAISTELLRSFNKS
jgi:hypothetical protein